ncbi:MAG: PD40 domain-containing protein [FCB group bacterium]|nr:PD40 domain-containing protein [FCB group bacterium]MBL7028584.1 PD40 domain-containing protein [Candidatus Neomarinimicrobiota bacterium]MBL7120803.1 PD40 domain-containing protein [Candidatus Neomarinimicrobiota bacterium]
MTNKAGLLISLLLLCSSAVLAKQIETKGDPVALSRPGEYYMGPKWSPSGVQVAAGGASYTGLYLLDFPTGNVQQISNDYSAGYGFAWSHDGTRIASKISHFNKMRRSHTLVSFNVSDGVMETLSEPRSRMSGTPVWTDDDSQLYLTFAEKFESFKTDDSNQEVSLPPLNYIKDGRFQNRLVLQSTGRSSETTLFSDQDHIYSYAISPDGSQVVYSTAGQNLWLAKVDGEDRMSLGRGSAPDWSPNGEWITFMLTSDDGHSITASDIYAIHVDGSSRIKLTETPLIFEMNPQWSPDGEWLVYDTDQRGQLFIQQVGWR